MPDVIQGPTPKGGWFKIRRMTLAHYFFESEDRSLCGLTNRRDVPANELHVLSTSAPIAETCLLCRRKPKG